MEDMKQCPFCGEDIKAVAVVCRYCRSEIQAENKDRKGGKLVRVRLKAGGKKYTGDIFIPERLSRVSDVINDSRTFIVLSNAIEEADARDVQIGFLAINKNLTEWLEIKSSGG